MANLTRKSFSIEQSLWNKLNRLLKDKGITNCSKYLCDVIREQLVQQEWEDESAEVVGTFTLVYDHHQRLLGDQLTDIQHDHHEVILAATHVHLDHDICAEMVMMKGKVKIIRHVADRLSKQKGVLHCSLAISSTGKSLR
jgi:CopG family transcriptional regulator, nickel-responsive regulator